MFDTDHFQYRKHHLLLFFLKQFRRFLLFILVFAVNSHINLLGLAIFYYVLDVQLSLILFRYSFSILNNIQGWIESQPIFLNKFLEFYAISHWNILPFVNLLLTCANQLLKLIYISFFQFSLYILHLHLGQCHLKLLILLLYIVRRIHLLHRIVLPRESTNGLHGLIHLLLLFLDLDLLPQILELIFLHGICLTNFYDSPSSNLQLEGRSTGLLPFDCIPQI